MSRDVEGACDATGRARQNLVPLVEARIDVDESLRRLKEKASPSGSGRVFISYAHDDIGQRSALSLMRLLRENGFNVTWDGDLPVVNPVSIKSWMDTEVADRTVVCVLSPEYVRSFGSDYPKKRGVRYESRLVMSKLYNSVEPTGCPIVPVAMPEFAEDLLPYALRGLHLSRFDPGTGAGGGDLVRRLAALAAAKEAPRPVLDVRRELEDVDPFSARARDLVLEMTDIEDPRVVESFDLMVAVAKTRGDVGLVRRVSQRCMRALPVSEHQRRDDGLREAKILVLGRAWHLIREHRLSAAVDAVERGAYLAKKFRDEYLAALADLCLAAVRLRQSGGGHGDERQHHVSASRRLLDRAIAGLMVHAGPHSVEVGEGVALSAEWYLTRHSFSGDRRDLVTALDEVDAAEGLLPHGSESRLRTTVLRSRIRLADLGHDEGILLVSGVIDALTGACSELLGTALQVRAELLLASGAVDDAVLDLERAVEVFRCLGQEYAAAVAWWTAVKVDPASARLEAHDVHRLEALSADPRIRLHSVEEHWLQISRPT